MVCEKTESTGVSTCVPGSRMLTSPKPACIPMTWPANCAASKTNCTLRPISTPINASDNISHTAPAGVRTSPRTPHTGYNKIVSRITKPALIRGAMALLPRNGVNTSRPETRAATVAAAATIASKDNDVGIGSAPQQTEIGEELAGEKRELAQHPWHQQDGADGRGQQTRHAGDGVVLQRGQHLHDVDGQRHQRQHDEQWRRQLHCSFKCLLTQVHDDLRRHGPPSQHQEKLFISEPTSRFQPSTITNSRILIGVEITTGGSCSMPTEVVMEATTRSMTRKGRNSTAPIWKPTFSSERM